MSTPRDEEEASTSSRQDARTTELQAALQNAEPDDFGSAFPNNVKSVIDSLVGRYMHSDFDTGARAYTFITNGKKAYIIETRVGKKGDERRNLYLYDAVGYPKTESTPLPLGKCEAPSLRPDARLTCKSVASGASLVDP